jgi:hypothetical protein
MGDLVSKRHCLCGDEHFTTPIGRCGRCSLIPAVGTSFISVLAANGYTAYGPLPYIQFEEKKVDLYEGKKFIKSS